MSDIQALARECGAVSYTPGPMRAVRGVSLTFEQLEAFAARLLAQATAPAPEPAGSGISDAEIRALWIEATNQKHGDTIEAWVRWFARALLAMVPATTQPTGELTGLHGYLLTQAADARDHQSAECLRDWARALPATTQPAHAEVPAVERAPVPDAVERLAINRYRPVPSGVLAYKVVGGDGDRSLFSGTKDECQIVARKLTEAFLDGAHVALAAPPVKEGAPAEAGSGQPATTQAQEATHWIRVVDEELVGAHLGVADASDDYNTAKAKLNKLIAWHVAVATDPDVNGGLSLQPVAAAPTQADSAPPSAQGDAPCDREDFAWLVVQEACETEPADEDDPECIRILRRDLKTAVLAAFLRAPKGDEAQVLSDAIEALPRYSFGYKSDEWGMGRYLTGIASDTGAYILREDALRAARAAMGGEKS